MIGIRKIFGFSSTKKIIKESSIYTFTNLINSAAGFLILPILTRYLTPEDYGIVTTFQIIRSFGVLFVGMGTIDAIIRAFYEKEKDNSKFNDYMSNAIIVIVSLFICITILIFTFSRVIEKFFPFPAIWLLLVPIVSIASVLANIVLKLWIVKHKAVQYAAFNISQTFFEILLSVIFVILFGLAWKGRLLGIAITESVVLLMGILLIGREHSFKRSVNSINYDSMKKILNYGIPVFFHSLGFWAIGSTDRFFLNKMVGLSATGIYSTGCSLSSIIGFLAGSFGMAWTPVFYEKLSNPTYENKVKIVKFTYLYYLGFSLLGILIILLSPYLVRIMLGKSFYGSIQFISWLVPGYVFFAMYRMVCGYIFYSKKTYIMMRITLSSAVVNLILNYVLIKINGAVGAAQAVFFTYMVSFFLTWWFGQKLFPMPWFSFLKAPIHSVETPRLERRDESRLPTGQA